MSLPNPYYVLKSNSNKRYIGGLLWTEEQRKATKYRTKEHAKRDAKRRGIELFVRVVAVRRKVA